MASSLFLDACQRKPTPRTPVWFMRQAGRYLPQYRKLRERYDLLTLCKTPELAVEITLQPIEELDVDAAILFSDLLLPLEPMGIRFHFAQGEGPVIENRVRSPQDIEALHPVTPEESLGTVLSAIGLTQKALANRLPLIGFAGAPFTLASYLIEGGHSRDFLATKSLLFENPDAWNKLMSKLSHVIKDFLLAQIEAGVDAVQLFDSWVGALTPEDYRQNVLPHSRGIIAEIAKTKTPLIHFGTQTAGMLPVFQEAGGDVVGVDWRIPLGEAWKILGPLQGIQGNLDPVALFAPVPRLKEKVCRILEEANGRPGHIFNLGHGVLPQTPVNHVKAVVEMVKSWRSST